MTAQSKRWFQRSCRHISTVLLAAGILVIAACGGALDPGSSETAGPSQRASATPHGWYWKDDSDNDFDDHHRGPSDDDQETIAAHGHDATPSDWRAITAVVREYYEAATNSQGAKGCALLQPSISTEVAAEQGSAHGTCAVSLTTLFHEQHAHLAAEDYRTMVFTGVHVAGGTGSVTMGFREAPEAEIVLEREGSAWKVAALFDSGLP